MRIRCPFCGERSHAEFSYLGDAAPTRPNIGTRATVPDTTLFVDYVYMRDNSPGVMREYWQHVGGCRSWLIVERNVTTHAISNVASAREQVLAATEGEHP
ncbi:MULTISPECIES: sarcosine oxidase subunit delta [Lichenihabitans]|uniref:sarcosine oxidase subunit delta n=1 Tax=Lichenihabitans TaxID=2723776 RepID=UPI001036AD5A|nr:MULTISPECIES: sarcosine oxidase subunit delta [Lichenihabitans]UDL96050.1 sarcosine oxidase subunit delta [Lichenihabitans sp. PAMC28606]